jgi:hypothetical protein
VNTVDVALFDNFQFMISGVNKIQSFLDQVISETIAALLVFPVGVVFVFANKSYAVFINENFHIDGVVDFFIGGVFKGIFNEWNENQRRDCFIAGLPLISKCT